MNLLTVGSAIRCLDLNSTRRRLAVVDENSDLLVYTLPDGQMQYRVSPTHRKQGQSETPDVAHDQYTFQC